MAASGGDSSFNALQNSNLQSQLAASQQQAKNEDPDGIFELFTELFNQAFSFVGSVSPFKVKGLVSTGITANVAPEASAPIQTGKNIMPGSGGPQGGVLAKGLSKVFNFKNLLAGITMPNIEALHLGESMVSASYSDLGTFSSPITPTSGINYDQGMQMA